MPSTPGHSEVPSAALATALDRLYSAPFDQFVAVRREIVEALRGSGDASTSRLVAAAAKPTRTAWALNQVARGQPELLRAVFSARHAAAASQHARDAAQIRETARDYRERVAQVVRAVRDLLAGQGVDLTVAQARRVGETLQAAAADESGVRRELVAGTLRRDIDSMDPFAGIEVGASRSPRQAEEPRAKPAEKPGNEERARAVAGARKRVSELELEARDARAKARDAEVAATRTQRLAEQARRGVGEADERLARARDELRGLDKK